MTDPHDLIKRLAEELDTWLMAHHHGGAPPEIQHAATLVAEARAYLAQPEPEGPTDEELNDLCADHGFVFDDNHGEGLSILSDIVKAVLAHWGRPAIKPEGPTDEELTLTYAYALAAVVDNKRGPFNKEDAEAARLAGLRAVLARWGSPPSTANHSANPTH